MQKMDADEAHELERLRARAYGPHADITSDPVALARMSANALDVVGRLFDPDRFMQNLFVELEKRTTT